MGITDCGEKVFRHVRSEATLNAYLLSRLSGKKLAVDVASFRLNKILSPMATPTQ